VLTGPAHLECDGLAVFNDNDGAEVEAMPDGLLTQLPDRSPAAVAVLLGAAVSLFVLVFLPAAVAQEPDDLGDVDAGGEVFANHCAACHGVSGEGRGAVPALIGVDDRHTIDEVGTVIRQGRAGMPAFDATLSDDQIDDVLAYVAQLPDDQAVGPGHGPHMDRWWDDMMWNGAGGVFVVVWMIFGLLLIVLLVVGIVWLVRQVSSDGGGRSDQQQQPPVQGSAREDLDRRYARGEISREEYREIRDDLEGRSGG
jgi:putative membrane protein